MPLNCLSGVSKLFGYKTLEDNGPGYSKLTCRRSSDGMGLPDAMSKETVDMIVATAGVVAPQALTITKTFYGGVLKKHPELLTYFNPAHNVPVSVHQPTALANSIVAYASNIQDLSPLLVPGGPVDAICHRHCALGIYPDQYVVVHDNLMASVGQVLGAAVTPPVANAWSQAVLFLARACIDKEEGLYKMAEQREGGWSGAETFEVVRIEDMTRDIKRFTFKPPAGTPLANKCFDFTPGQYLTLTVDPDGNGRTAPRHYTVTSPPGADFLQCTIKKIPGGKVSTFVHDQLRVGHKVKLAAPFGVFTCEGEALKESTVLMTAGIGVTPSVNFSKALGDKVKLIVHVDKNAESFAYREEFQASGHPMLEKYTEREGRISASALVRETVSKSGVNNNFYLCGPASWMEEVSAELKTQGAKKVMCEVFGSQLGTGCPFMQKAA